MFDKHIQKSKDDIDMHLSCAKEEELQKMPCFAKNTILNFKYDRGAVLASVGFMILTCATALGFMKHTILPIGFSIAYVVFAIIACMHCVATDEIDRGILRQVYLLAICMLTEVLCAEAWFFAQ